MAKEKKEKVTKPAEEYITPESIIASGLIPNLEPLNLRYIGKNWYKETSTGTAYHFTINEHGHIGIKETRQSKAETKAKIKAEPKPKVIKPKTVEITCVDCGGKRTIATQDVFQVKRCVVCQTKYRNAKRSARIQAKKTAKSPQERPTVK